MNTYGSRGRTGVPAARTVPDLCITNYDRMQRDVTILVTDDAEQEVFSEEQHISRGGDLTRRGVFSIDGTYRVTVSLRYGTSTTTTHTVRPGRTGICLDIHPDGIDTYSVSQ